MESIEAHKHKENIIYINKNKYMLLTKGNIELH